MENNTRSPFVDYTVEQRTRIGFMLYNDAYEKKFKYARDLLTGLVDLEVRMAIFNAVEGRLVDLNSLEDAASVFGDTATELLNEAKDWAQEAVTKQAEFLMPFIDQETMEQITALMRVPNKPTVLGMRDWRNSLKADLRRAEEKKVERRNQFNSQHKPAPEGTVKELAAKYGKSLSEIRRLKAEGLLHTLGA